MKKTMMTLLAGTTLLASTMTAFAATPVLISAQPELIAEKEQISEEAPQIDIPMYHWAAESVERLVEMGLVEDKLVANYDDAMAKEEFVAAMTAIFDLTDAEVEGYFAEDGDVEAVTRLQVAVILEQIFEAKEIQVRLTMMNPVFNDIEEDFHQFGAISFVVNAGIMNGDHEGNFNPNAELTFAEGATILSRVVDIVGVEEVEVEDEMEKTEIPAEMEEAVSSEVVELDELEEAVPVQFIEATPEQFIEATPEQFIEAAPEQFIEVVEED